MIFHVLAPLLLLILATPAAAQLVKVYEHDFSTAGGWQALYSLDSAGLVPLYQAHASGGTHRRFGGVAWRDMNHWHTKPPGLPSPNISHPGAGELNIWAFNSAATAGIVNTDLRGGEVRLRIRAVNGLRIHSSARVGWWMQAFDGAIGKNVNYFNRVELTVPLGFDAREGGHAITAATSPDWVDVIIPLSTENRDWDCLGARPDKVQYGCSKNMDALLAGAGTLINFGIITLMTQDAGAIPHQGGEFHIDHIEIWAQQ